MASLKRCKLSDDDKEREADGALDVVSSTDDDVASDSDEIAATRTAKSKKTSRRKRRATEPFQFGATLEVLLETDVQSTLPLSLKPAGTRKHKEEKLDRKAKRVHLVEKKEKEDKCRITDVIGGWGATNERELRKVAQRGVVKLFNIIQQSQLVGAENTKSLQGTGKATLPAPASNARHMSQDKRKRKSTLGNSQNRTVSKEEFFDMIRSGGLVSKT